MFHPVASLINIFKTFYFRFRTMDNRLHFLRQVKKQLVVRHDILELGPIVQQFGTTLFSKSLHPTASHVTVLHRSRDDNVGSNMTQQE